MKLNKAGIEYISEMYDEFEEHVREVATAVRGTKTCVDMDRSRFLYKKITWVTYWRDEVDCIGTLEVSDEDFASMDYEATRVKHEKLREEKKQREKKVEETKKAKEEVEWKIKQQEFKRQNIEDEKVMLGYLMKKYPELTK